MSVLLAASLLPLNANTEPTLNILRSFDPPTETPKWIAQNDDVMGGVSTGQAELADRKLHFRGELSLENNGGFAQIYSQTETSDFSSHSAVRLRVKGDGRSYQFRIATDARFRGSRIAYRAEFATKADTWIELSLPFSAFTPSFRGRQLSGPLLNLSAVREIAFLLGDGKPGEFALQVDWIGLD